MKKFLFASFAMVALVGFVAADEFTATINKVDGNTVTYTKKAFGGGGAGGKKGGKADPAAPQPKEEKADCTSDVKVLKGTFDFGGGAGGKKGGAGGKKGGGAGGIAVKAGDPLEGGLKNEVFTKMDDKKGVFAQITTNDAGKITQIVTITFGKKGGIE